VKWFSVGTFFFLFGFMLIRALCIFFEILLKNFWTNYHVKLPYMDTFDTYMASGAWNTKPCTSHSILISLPSELQISISHPNLPPKSTYGQKFSFQCPLGQHYQLYKSKCEEADIPINHWAIPCDIWKVMEEENAAEKQGRRTKKQQQQLLCFETITGPCEFTRSAVLNAVTKLRQTTRLVTINLLPTVIQNSPVATRAGW
jgi:hypothetical protein